MKEIINFTIRKGRFNSYSFNFNKTVFLIKIILLLMGISITEEKFRNLIFFYLKFI